MTATATAGGRHRHAGAVLPEPPDDVEKGSYAWRSLPFLTAALCASAVCVLAAQAWMEIRYPLLLAFAGLHPAVLRVPGRRLPVNFTGRSFDLVAHVLRIRAWSPAAYPAVDIFLPVCGEPIEVLRNTWTGVFELIRAYPGAGPRLRPG